MNKISSDLKNVNLLWTGGWDSTFQLLRLLILYRFRVTPFYLIDTTRRSFNIEIMTMNNIKSRLLKEYPNTKALLQPTQYFSVADISSDLDIAKAYQSIVKNKHLGSQYHWLAQFCMAKGIADMQLCNISPTYHRDKTHFDFEEIVSDRTERSQSALHIDPKYQGTDEYVLFRYFSFPVIKITKIQMSDIADMNGWEKIMSLTWFCHTPTRNIKPCGNCNPCHIALEEGLGWRLPRRSRMIYFFKRQFVWPLKSLTKSILNMLGLLKYIHKDI